MADHFELIGPFGARPRLAIAVSGGADSMALALRARDWVAARDGRVLGLIVDHGLRPGSAAEAALVCKRLSQLGVPAQIITLSGLAPGADAARRARHAALEQACVRHGLVHLLFGHHADDQDETLQMRVLAGSGAAGLAGMSGLRETYFVRQMRPLLGCRAITLRNWLTERGVAWVEDPSNADRRAQRGRLRQAACVPDAGALRRAAAQAGQRRAAAERRGATWLAHQAMIFPEGFALIPAGVAPEPALAALVQMIAGSAYPPAPAAITTLASRLRSGRGGSLGGVIVVQAGRLGEGWLLAREVAAAGPPVPAIAGAVWDRRFRLLPGGRDGPPGSTIGPVNEAASRLRKHSHLPSVVLRGLPAIWLNDMLVAVPHLGYPDASVAEQVRLRFCPARPAACAPWFNAPAGPPPA